MKVANRKCIRRLSIESMKAAKIRNIIAVISIALTTVLFTSFFTIVMSIVYGYEQSNFRSVGGYAHAGFKYLTREQFDELKEDPLIEEYCLRRFVGMPYDIPFNKAHVEVGYSDANSAKWMFIEPKEGRLPGENTMEAATDTRVLGLLGVEPELGTQFTMTFYVDGTETTETFTLCGWWEYDEAIVASHVLLPESRAEDIYEKLGTQGLDGMTARYNMDVMLKSKAHIAEDVENILERHGYQSEDSSQEDNYIATGVNWGYVSAQISDSLDFETVFSIGAMILLIIFTGYLIIYNVFQISVSNDIRFYGLLKTIGTTGKQLKRIVFQQAVTLSAIGIPIGLALGYGIGIGLTPVVLSQLDGIIQDGMSVNPLIFIGAVLFSLVTVMISCRKPSRMAAKVSPIEAVRYTEGQEVKKRAHGRQKKVRKGEKGASIFRMAWANLGRNRKKTIITVISMTLAVVLFNMTFIFTNGFDMNKYVSKMVVTDFLVADATYMQVSRGFSGADTAVGEEVIADIEKQGGISEGGRTYGTCSFAFEFSPEDHYRQRKGQYISSEYIDLMIKNDGVPGDRVIDTAQLFGMESFCIDKLNVYEGDLSKLYGEGNYIAAVYMSDDYGNMEPDTQWAKLGDKVTIRYADEVEYYNLDTGEIYDAGNVPGNQPVMVRPVKYRDVEYEVAAIVDVPGSLSYRYYGSDAFVLNADIFKRDTGTEVIMYYAFDVEEGTENSMESFLSDYTQNIMPEYDYESRALCVKEFESFRSMFVIMGSALSFIIGLVGILNFLNAILTGILARHYEFAVLQSVGMTGKQLKTILVTEGLFYALGTVALALLFNIAGSPVISSALTSMFWFFTYHFTITPIIVVTPFFILLGILLPLITYKYAAKKSVVERLRETE